MADPFASLAQQQAGSCQSVNPFAAPQQQAGAVNPFAQPSAAPANAGTGWQKRQHRSQTT